MRICAVSDLHGNLPTIPPCDVLLIAGDVCPLEDHSKDFQERWLRREFSEWLCEEPGIKIGVAGNHDLVTESRAALGPSLPWHYLLNSSIQIEGVKFWGSPMSATFGSWAWMTHENALNELWERIPMDTDVTLIHTPPLGARDRTYFGDMVGSESLRERLKRVRPLLHVCGHIHPAYGVDAIYYEGGQTLVANASIVNGLYEHVNKPLRFVLDMEKREALYA